MLLEKSDAILDLSDPNVILGPCKYCPTECLLGNGDPLVCKKKKKDQDDVSTGTMVSSTTDNGNYILSLMLPSPPLSLINQAHTALNVGQNTNHTQSHGAQAIMVDDDDEESLESHGTDEDEGATTEENDNAELCTCSINLDYFYRLIHRLAWLQKFFDSPIYAFFKPLPTIKYIQGCKSHVLECAATMYGCKTRFVCWFLDKSDARSTSNLQHHAKICWSDEAVDAADGFWDIKAM